MWLWLGDDGIGIQSCILSGLVSRDWHEIPVFTIGGVWNWLMCEDLGHSFEPTAQRCLSKWCSVHPFSFPSQALPLGVRRSPVKEGKPCFCIPPHPMQLSPWSERSQGQSWGRWCCCCCLENEKNECFSFKVPVWWCLLDKVGFSQHKSLAQELHSVSSYFMCLLSRLSHLKKGKREIYPLKVSFLLNLCLSLVCHVNYIPNNPLAENSAIKL